MADEEIIPQEDAGSPQEPPEAPAGQDTPPAAETAPESFTLTREQWDQLQAERQEMQRAVYGLGQAVTPIVQLFNQPDTDDDDEPVSLGLDPFDPEYDRKVSQAIDQRARAHAEALIEQRLGPVEQHYEQQLNESGRTMANDIFTRAEKEIGEFDRELAHSLLESMFQQAQHLIPPGQERMAAFNLTVAAAKKAREFGERAEKRGADALRQAGENNSQAMREPAGGNVQAAFDREKIVVGPGFAQEMVRLGRV